MNNIQRLLQKNTFLILNVYFDPDEQKDYGAGWSAWIENKSVSAKEDLYEDLACSGQLTPAEAIAVLDQFCAKELLK